MRKEEKDVSFQAWSKAGIHRAPTISCPGGKYVGVYRQIRPFDNRA